MVSEETYLGKSLRIKEAVQMQNERTTTWIRKLNH